MKCENLLLPGCLGWRQVIWLWKSWTGHLTEGLHIKYQCSLKAKPALAMWVSSSMLPWSWLEDLLECQFRVHGDEVKVWDLHSTFMISWYHLRSPRLPQCSIHDFRKLFLGSLITQMVVLVEKYSHFIIGRYEKGYNYILFKISEVISFLSNFCQHFIGLWQGGGWNRKRSSMRSSNRPSGANAPVCGFRETPTEKNVLFARNWHENLSKVEPEFVRSLWILNLPAGEESRQAGILNQEYLIQEYFIEEYLIQEYLIQGYLKQEYLIPEYLI